MGLFGSITEKFNNTFKKLNRKGKITENDIKEAFREIKIALLEADVNFFVVKSFMIKLNEKALDQKVLESLTPTQHIIKIVNEELIRIMGGSQSRLEDSHKPTNIMMCGLQGVGKTTFIAKLANYLKSKNKKVLIVAADVYRPAAIDQITIMAKKIDVDVYERGAQSPSKTVKDAVSYSEKMGYDYTLIDTAGRLSIDKKLMDELIDISKSVNMHETLLVIDSMMGQESVNISREFNEKLGVTGIILTKLDGDTRGGVALSIKEVIGIPIKFIGMGEKIEDIDLFYPERMANRILGKGDVLSLIEKAESSIDLKEKNRLEKAFKENSFTLDDYLVQFNNISKMGNISSIMSMLPGFGKIKNAISNVDEKSIIKQKAIIQSMTKREKTNPNIIKSSRKVRIAKGSSTTVQDVNSLLKQFDQTKLLIKNMKSGKGVPKMPF